MGLQRTAEPAVLASARARLDRALERVWSKPRTRGPEPDPLLQHPDVVAALREMSAGTCSYCERPLPETGSDSLVVTHHRPTWGAVGLDGSVDPQSYWWLTYDWANLLPACSDCVRTRGSRFPVEGERLRPGDDVAQERALLLDPVADDPDQHLRFEADGTVTALTERGKVTYELLALNRDSLVRARNAAARQLATSATGPPEHSFSTLRRQLTQTVAAAPTTPGPSVPLASRLVGPTLPPTSGAEPGMPAYDLTSPMADTERAKYFQTSQWIERVVIKNFRPIRDLEIDLSRSTSERGPWTVLLGENGSGKSSVLHAVALTLMGGEQRRRLGIDARTYLRHRARRGRVQVYLSGRTDPLELTWAAGDSEFTGPEQVPALLLGYGATRLLPRYTGEPPDPRVVRVDNLFDPLLPLTDPTSWLLSLEQDTFEDVAEGIHGLLALGPDAALVRTRGRVLLQQGRDKSDLATLSDGYQSMVVMASDILRSILTLWKQPALAEGIVLIDEVGAHLHPRWRMRVVPALRHLMPRVQFVVTTHEPLCLRGVQDGEVVVVRRNSEGEVVTITDLPPVAGMRIEQLLTSEHFGLGTTDDPEVADLWETYYSLQGMPSRSAEQEAHLEQVRARLDELEQFGTTERDRLLLTSAAKFIADRRESGDAVAQTRADVTTEMARLWSAHLPGGES